MQLLLMIVALNGPVSATESTSLDTLWPATLPCEEFLALEPRGMLAVQSWSDIPIVGTSSKDLVASRPSALLLSAEAQVGDWLQLKLQCADDPLLSLSWRCEPQGCSTAATFRTTAPTVPEAEYSPQWEYSGDCSPSSPDCQPVSLSALMVLDPTDRTSMDQQEEQAITALARTLLSDASLTLKACDGLPCSQDLLELDEAFQEALDARAWKLEDLVPDPSDQDAPWLAHISGSGTSLQISISCHSTSSPNCRVQLGRNGSLQGAYRAETDPAPMRQLQVEGGYFTLMPATPGGPVVMFNDTAMAMDGPP